MSKTKCLSIFLLGAFIALAIGAIMNGKGAKEPIKEIEKIKIVKITDTVEVPEPIPYLIENTDTVYVTQMYIGNGQPLEVPLIKQTVTYSDSTYKAVISGYDPKLEYIETYNTTHYITETVYEKPKKWGIGIQAGYGIGRNGLQPYVGVGVSYNLIRF